jgi:ATP-binding cassette subfamily B protein
MDEATSALDSLSEQSVQKAVLKLRERGKTVILIAHRLSTVLKADKIVVMKSGEVIEEGNHEKLLGKRGAYYTMWEQQFPMIAQLGSNGHGDGELAIAAS